MRILRNNSLKVRLTLLFGALMLAFSAVLLFFIFSMSATVFRTKAQQNLIRTVERDLDEAEYDRGVFEPESDFVYYSNGAHILIYDNEGSIIAGTLPEGFSTDEGFTDGYIRTVDSNDETYFIYDSHITYKKYEYSINARSGEILTYGADYLNAYVPYSGDMGALSEGAVSVQRAYEIALENENIAPEDAILISALYGGETGTDIYSIEFYSETEKYDSVWLRGIVVAEDTNGMSSLATAALIILPILIALFCFIGFIMTKRALKPLDTVTDTAYRLKDGDNLSERIGLSNGPSEIIRLSAAFDNMAENLQKAFERERRFTSDVSHELRTPVTVVLAECSDALDENSTDSDVREALAVIKRQTEKMKHLITRLLEFARMEQGRIKLSLENANLSELAEAVCEDASMLTNSKNISVEADIQSGIFMNMDVSLMARLLDNLISNAVKYGRKNGYVRVALRQDDSRLVLEVSDNGIGIKETDINEIWQSFYRTNDAISELGSGLGLPIVKRIAVLHGGTVGVTSVYGEGSTFSVTFPINGR